MFQDNIRDTLHLRVHMQMHGMSQMVALSVLCRFQLCCVALAAQARCMICIFPEHKRRHPSSCQAPVAPSGSCQVAMGLSRRPCHSSVGVLVTADSAQIYAVHRPGVTANSIGWGYQVIATMCGILAALGLQGDPEKNRRMMLRQSKLLRHRGPDANAIWQSKDGNSFICFERLQIIDVTDGGK